MNKFIDIINTTNRKPIFVDINNILYRSYYVFPPEKFKSSQGLPSGHLFGLCQNIRTMDKLNYEIFLCEDSPCEWRHHLKEEYKSNRESLGFYKDFQKIRDLISNLDHAHTLQSDMYEADDIMYSAAKICSELNRDCDIFTADKDLLQSLDEHITVVKKVTLKENEEIKYKSEEYNKLFPVEPKKLAIYRAFKGDSSDNLEIPVKRLPKDLLLDLVDYLYENNSLANYQIKKKSHEKWIKELINNWTNFLDNYNIMKLNKIPFNVLDKSDKNSYIKVCKDYDLFQFSKYINELEHNIK